MECKDTLRELIQNCLAAFSSPDASPPIQSRSLIPFTLTSTRDARGDAVSLLVEKMVHSKLPHWSAYILAYDFVDIFAEKLHTGRDSLSDNQIIDASNWCRELRECFAQYLKKIVDGAHKLPPLLDEWEAALPVSFCYQKNRKPKMEDRHLILPSLAVVEPNFVKVSHQNATREDAFFAVFDGHNGAECATYASAHLAECLFDSLEETSDDVEEVLSIAFERLDKRITEKCKSEKIKSGTTVSCVYLKGACAAFLAWCGDSSIGVLRNAGVETLSIPHKPEDQEEMKRIEEAGGMVVSIHGVPRLNGVLNLSRSLGDIQAKPMVSSVPDTKRVELSAGDHVLFLATDGVWDSFEEEEIFELCLEFIRSHPPQDFELLAEFIVNKAKSAGSSDNLTLICIFLRPINEVWTKF
uniref:PPM-type phosphatase domain-containing protein n=1 Tax=Globodera rostochiensis TaxID=31243 RepID=A0A914HBP5_GLORO